MNFDLAAVDTTAAEDGVYMELKDAAGEPVKNSKGEVPAIKLLGLDSKTYRDYQRRFVLRRIRRESAKGKPGIVEPTVDEQAAETEKDTLDQLVMMTVGWKNFRDDKGATVQFSPEAARELYSKYPIVAEQVDMFCASRANFMKRP